MKNLLLFGGVVVVLLVGVSLWSSSWQSDDPGMISRDGIHWHPQLEIFVDGEKVDIPANIGVGLQYVGLPTFDSGMRMTAIHTHDDTPAIHLEFPGRVREGDLTFGNFFRIWGKDMRSFGENMRMTVNGAPNTEFERHIMRDNDIIELHYD